MSSTTLLLVRHAHAHHNGSSGNGRLAGWSDERLSDTGLREALRLSERLAAGPRPAAIYCSTLRRARDTASLVARPWSLSPVCLDDLREIGCGEVDGWRIADVERQWPALWRRHVAQDDEWFRWPGGESYIEFRARVWRALGQIAAAHREAIVVVVTHAGVLTQLAGALDGIPPCRWEVFRPGNASITEVTWPGDPRDVRIVRFDDRAHLEADVTRATPHRHA